MKGIIIKKTDFDHSVEKEDVCIVYLTSGKYWVCDKDKPIEEYNEQLYKLNLAAKSEV